MGGNPVVLDTSQIGDASQKLARAFHAHQLATYVLPQEERREQALATYFRIVVGTALRRGEVHANNPDLDAIAIWLPPHQHATGSMIGAAFGPLVRAAGPVALWRGFGYMRHLHKLHRRHCWPQHWYLHTLGVVPEQQNQGIGATLLQHMLTRLDALGQSCCLESPVGRPEDFYLRHGFTSVDTAVVSGTQLGFSLMVRPPHRV